MNINEYKIYEIGENVKVKILLPNKDIEIIIGKSNPITLTKEETKDLISIIKKTQNDAFWVGIQ